MANDQGLWSTDLCSCFSDCKSCWLTFWCPCVTFGELLRSLTEYCQSSVSYGALYFLLSLLTGRGCIILCCYRTKIREHYRLKGTNCEACMVHFFCEPCALCQEYRELQNNGFDVSLGWYGNLERVNKGLARASAPKVEAGMERQLMTNNALYI